MSSPEVDKHLESYGPAVVGSRAMTRGKLRTPREDRSLLVQPPLSEIGALLTGNVSRRGLRDYDLQGRSLAKVSRMARADMLCEAYRWTSSYRDTRRARPAGDAPVLLAGHQPQLFHPGVWFKNFALAAMAARHGAVAVNLVIDSDTIKGTSLPVPTGTPNDAHRVSIPFDQPGPAVPYESRRILDRGTFVDFGRAVVERMRGLMSHPLVSRYWPLVVARSHCNDNLGVCLAQARHQLEGQWGLDTLEVPQSRICQSESFLWLVAHVLAQLPRFRQVYNEAVREYRAVNGIRNAAHPVPDLAKEGQWLEAPFWIWSTSDPTRRPLFAAQQGNELRLTNRHGLEISLPLSAEGDAQAAVARLMEFPGRGIKIRSRALVTTLWARLALGDVFIHGIGGGKYDQVTDALIERFFGLQAPGFVVLSATLYLPVATPEERADEAAAIDRRLRDLVWHPERFLAPTLARDSEPRLLAVEKQHWIDTPQTPDNARQRRQALRRINQALQRWMEPQREELNGRRESLARAARLRQVLAWREYAFCLYPEELLREFFFGLLE